MLVLPTAGIVEAAPSTIPNPVFREFGIEVRTWRRDERIPASNFYSTSSLRNVSCHVAVRIGHHTATGYAPPDSLPVSTWRTIIIKSCDINKSWMQEMDFLKLKNQVQLT